MPVSRYRVGVTPSFRSAAGASAVALVLIALAGCSPEPEPTPEPTAAFASEEEAFQAAEETYRAYTDALSQVSLEDPSTFEPVFDWLINDARTNERETLSQMSAAGIAISGSTSYVSYTPLSYNAKIGEIVANLCIDVSEVELVDESGASLTPADRPDLQPVKVEFAPANTSTRLAIARSSTVEDFECAP